MVRFPKKEDASGVLGSSRVGALRVLQSTECRTEQDPILKEKYKDFMAAYFSLGHMDADLQWILWQSDPAARVQDFRLTTITYGTASASYLAIRTLLQLAQDEGARCPLGSDALRLNTSDTIKMFRQIRVHPDDLDLQRILWRAAPAREVQDFHFSTLTYRNACAPYLALRTLKQLVSDEGSQFPLGATVVTSHMYIDDVLAGAASLKQALAVKAQIIASLEAGGFQLIPAGKPTKRTVLSDAARLFDPGGWATPVLIGAKLFIQELWKAGLEWDEQLPPHLVLRWRRLATALQDLENLHLPRWTGVDNNGSVELHGFSDASEKAYAAVMYLRCTRPSGQQTGRWKRPGNKLRAGALVLNKDDLQPPSKWTLAQIRETHPGADGLVRVVNVDTAPSTLTRPITKICPLPVSD